MNKKYLKIICLMTISSSTHALDMNCLRKENGECVSISNEIGKSMAKSIMGTPKAMLEIATGVTSEINKEAKNTRMPPKSMKECMKENNGVIDNETVRCRYGYLIEKK